MSAPECTCAIVWDAIKQAEVIRKCALCRAAAQMYEELKYVIEDTEEATISLTLSFDEDDLRRIRNLLVAARGETERVR